MTKKETAEIVKLMNAYFRRTGSATVGTMIDAWHEALKDQDFARTRRAVVQFAKNDRRDYPTWPAVGQIIAAIEDEKKTENRPVMMAYSGLCKGSDYESLPREVRDRLTPEKYAEFMRLDAEAVVARGKEVRAKLKVLMRDKK